MAGKTLSDYKLKEIKAIRLRFHTSLPVRLLNIQSKKMAEILHSSRIIAIFVKIFAGIAQW